MENRIILEDRFTTHQKLIFLCIGIPFVFAIIGLLSERFNNQGFLLLLVLVMIFGFLISTAFLKRGFLKVSSALYRGSFFCGVLFCKRKIDISETPKVAVLKFTKSQKLAWFSAAKPDLATSFNSFEINILNEKHTKREPIIILRKSVNVEPLLIFLTANFDLKKEVYSLYFN